MRGSPIVLGALLLAAAGHAETRTLATAGAWEAFGGTTSKGNPICGMSTEVDTHYFSVKRISGFNELTLQMGTRQWKLGNQQKLGVVMTIDGNSAWRAHGTGMRFDDGDPGLEFRIGQSDIETFVQEFRSGTSLRLQFPDANFADWKLSLAGSSAVSDAFAKCLRTLP